MASEPRGRREAEGDRSTEPKVCSLKIFKNREDSGEIEQKQRESDSTNKLYKQQKREITTEITEITHGNLHEQLYNKFKILD